MEVSQTNVEVSGKKWKNKMDKYEEAGKDYLEQDLINFLIINNNCNKIVYQWHLTKKNINKTFHFKKFC